MDWLLGLSTWRKRALGAAIVITLLCSALPVRASTPEVSPEERAADWIAREYGAPDSEIKLFGTGILIDSLVSLAATGTEPSAAQEMLDDLRGQVAAYVGSGESFRPGAAGKVIHVLHVYDEDVSSFVGTDLVSELRSTMAATGEDVGRFGQASVLDQALGVLGLSLTAEGAPDAAVQWLAAAGCPSGEFTYDGTCPGPTDADTTGLAALALLAAGNEAAAGTAVEWLLGVQNPDGSIPGYGTPNTNSTAAAAQAFVAAGEAAAASAAAGYIEGMQFSEAAGPDDAGGLRWLAADTAANTFATVQGVWGMGIPPIHLLGAPSLVFGDVRGSIFGKEIEWLAKTGITRGCNPPANDHFCPEALVTRGEMAAFLNRAFHLPAGTDSGFADIGGTLFLADIEAIAAAGITRGCNPPDNDRFCPEGLVTRAEMAAFLNRALDLPAVKGSSFIDISGSQFGGDIEAIAAAGITRGCNPPANDRFCPNEHVTRDQLSAFLFRAFHP